MKKIKEIKEVYGNLGYPAGVGKRAIICLENSTELFTSKVVDIRNETNTGIEIETMNTIYRLIYMAEVPYAV